MSTWRFLHEFLVRRHRKKARISLDGGREESENVLAVQRR